MPVAFLLGAISHLMPITKLDQQPSELLDHTHIEVELTDPQCAVLVLSIDQGCDAHLSDATQYAIDFDEELDREPME
jgi:hypothetical protein